MSQLIGFLLKGFGPLASQTEVVASGTSIQHSLAVSIRDDIRAMIVAGTLTGIVSDSVQERYVPSLRDYVSSGAVGTQHTLPGILVVHPQIGDTVEQRDNRRDELGFPVLIAIAAQTWQALTFDDATCFGWRKSIIHRFRVKGYSIADPATDFHKCRVEPGPIIDWDRWAKDGSFTSWFILRFYTVEQRPAA